MQSPENFASHKLRKFEDELIHSCQTMEHNSWLPLQWYHLYSLPSEFNPQKRTMVLTLWGEFMEQCRIYNAYRITPPEHFKFCRLLFNVADFDAPVYIKDYVPSPWEELAFEYITDYAGFSYYLENLRYDAKHPNPDNQRYLTAYYNELLHDYGFSGVNSPSDAFRQLEDFTELNGQHRANYSLHALRHFWGSPEQKDLAAIGSGIGIELTFLRQAIGDEAMLYAVDTNPCSLDALDYLHPDDDVETVLSDVDNCDLPYRSIDIAFMTDIHVGRHDMFDDEDDMNWTGLAYLHSVAQALRPGGALLICDHQKQDHLSEFNEQVVDAGFTYLGQEEAAPGIYVSAFKRNRR